MSAPATPAPSSTPRSTDLTPYDGVLLVSFGGPESPEEVMPFLRRVTAGRDIPEERLAEVATHYLSRGGVSPINAQNRALVAALRDALAAAGAGLDVRLGNRNSPPFLADTIASFVEDGATRLVAVLTSAYSSYSSCRQYRENLAEAVASLGPAAAGLVIDKIEPWHGLPAFVDANARATTSALRGIPVLDPATTRVLGVTHSIPDAMAETSGPPLDRGRYVAQHRAVLAAIDARVRAELGVDLPAELVFCSRSGPPRQPWLEPDVSDRIRELAGHGVRDIVLVPIGFVSDHMEVVSDLDTDAVAAGAQAGVRVLRVPTVGTDPGLVTDLVGLLGDRAALARGERPAARTVLAEAAPPAQCPPGCCPNLRSDRPALCGAP